MSIENSNFVVNLGIELSESQASHIEKEIKKSVLRCLVDFDLLEDRKISEIDDSLGGPGGFHDDHLFGMFLK